MNTLAKDEPIVPMRFPNLGDPKIYHSLSARILGMEIAGAFKAVPRCGLCGFHENW